MLGVRRARKLTRRAGSEDWRWHIVGIRANILGTPVSHE